MKQHVALIFGGVSTEHEISIISATSIAQSIDRETFEPLLVGIDKTGRWWLGPGAFDRLKGDEEADATPVILSTDPEKSGFLNLDNGELTTVDVIFPVLHGPRGEDGTIQGLFELAGIPFVGCDTLASAVSMDKDMTKRILAREGLPVVRGAAVDTLTWQTSREDVMEEIIGSLKLPIFIKPATMGSSVGVTKASNFEEIEAAIDKALTFSLKAVVEESVEEAREIEVAVLGNEDPQASVPGQIMPKAGFYDYASKYVDNSTELIIPASLTKATTENLQFLACEAFAAVGGSGMARVDFLITEDHVYINEINTIPGFTSISMYPKLWEKSGIPYGELITTLIGLAYDRFEEKEALTKTITPDKQLGV